MTGATATEKPAGDVAIMKENTDDSKSGSGSGVEPVANEKKLSSDGELEANHLEIQEAEAQRILKKVDYRLVPILALLYLVAFIDRSNSEFAFSKSLIPISNPQSPMAISLSPLNQGSWEEGRRSIELTITSRQRKDRRPHRGFEHEGHAVQHRGDAVLRAVHAARSTEQYCAKDDEAERLDCDFDVFMGAGDDVSTPYCCFLCFLC